MAASIHAAGASVNINRTMIPANHNARVPYKITNIPPSVISENKKNNPTGVNGMRICRSKKNDVHVVG